jgi:hypothetical protein
LLAVSDEDGETGTELGCGEDAYHCSEGDVLLYIPVGDLVLDAVIDLAGEGGAELDD